MVAAAVLLGLVLLAVAGIFGFALVVVWIDDCADTWRECQRTETLASCCKGQDCG
jgi:hypothetical protein